MVYAGIGVLAVLLWGVVTYNKFVALRRKAGEAWSGVSVQLKRRHDLIPNLVDVVKGYAAHEADLFSRVAQMRGSLENVPSNGPTGDLLQKEGELGALVGRLFAVSEAYPDLKASESFSQLHAALCDVEDQLQMARRYYNGTVRNYMILYESFPSMVVPKIFSFERAEYFELESAAERTAPAISF